MEFLLLLLHLLLSHPTGPRLTIFRLIAIDWKIWLKQRKKLMDRSTNWPIKKAFMGARCWFSWLRSMTTWPLGKPQVQFHLSSQRCWARPTVNVMSRSNLMVNYEGQRLQEGRGLSERQAITSTCCCCFYFESDKRRMRIKPCSGMINDHFMFCNLW